LTPISRHFGYDRGLPVDRHYIEGFLAQQSGGGRIVGDIRGRVLEIGDDSYSRMFGGSLVEQVDVLHVDESNPRATVVADLATGGDLESDAYDCFICTQTLQLIYDVRRAVETIYRILAPGGVVLVTAPGISQLARPYADLGGDHWRFTSRSLRRLFEEVFPPANVKVEAYGNVLSSIAFLHGIATEDLRREELDVRDPEYELIVAVRALKES
jgi:SAM-dependent methyltransferase